jgi:hypothetical protein
LMWLYFHVLVEYTYLASRFVKDGISFVKCGEHT